MTNLDSILKSRDFTLPTKVRLVKAMVFPVVMCGCESWTMRKPEHRKIDAFELWCWRRLLRIPWTARRSNRSILKEISLGYSLEGLMLKLKLQYFGHLMRRADSLEKTLMLGEIGGRRRRGNRGWDGWMASQTRWAWVWVCSRSWQWTVRPGVLWFLGLQRVAHDWATELNNNNSCWMLKINCMPHIPGGSEGKAFACNAGDLGSIPWLGRSPGEGNGNPLQYSFLENPIDREAW